MRGNDFNWARGPILKDSQLHCEVCRGGKIPDNFQNMEKMQDPFSGLGCCQHSFLFGDSKSFLWCYILVADA